MSHPAIQLHEVEKSFRVSFGVGHRTALNKLSLSVEPGEIYGFLGPNGAGKTTSIKVLTSLLKPDGGTASVFGQSPALEETRRRIGFLPESPVFYDHLTSREFLHFCGRLCGMDTPAVRRRAGELLERVGLGQAADLQIRRYSKGMNQRVGIAQALIHDPELIILDEPMSGLDPMGRADVRDLIVDLKKQGKTVFFSTHIIPDVEIICDRIGLVNRGRTISEGSVQELLSAARSSTTEVLVQGLAPGCAPPMAKEISASANHRLFTVDSDQRLGDLLAMVLAQQARVLAVTPRRETLEDLVVRVLGQDRAAA
jgi:ABC-2 type transport system ATP-binding protein